MEKMSQYRLPQKINGFTITTLEKLFEDNSDFIFEPHKTENFQIIWFKNQVNKHWIDFDQKEILGESIIFLNNSVVHAYDRHSQGMVIIFNHDFFNHDDSDIKFLNDSVLFCELLSIYMINLVSHPNTPFKTLFDLISSKYEDPEDLEQPAIIKNYLHNILLEGEQIRKNTGFRKINKGLDFKYIVHFRNLLEENYDTVKKVGSYAKIIGVTERRLNLASQNVFGKSVKEVIDARVILEAKRRLAHTDGSIKEISYCLGFAEPTHFIKFFKKYNKSTPVDFKNNYL